MTSETARSIAEAYGWQRSLGHSRVATPYGHVVANPAHPEVWDANHADRITARTRDEIDAVPAAMDEHLSHTLGGSRTPTGPRRTPSSPVWRSRAMRSGRWSSRWPCRGI